MGYLVFFGPVAAAMALLIFAGREVSRRFTTHKLPKRRLTSGTSPKVSRR